jgi:exodeoxyribonuclease-5
MELTDKQKYVLYKLMKGVEEGTKEQTMGGYAGTGKTTLIKYLVKFLPHFGTIAYTGKAANVLRRKDILAKTIHNTIYRPVYDYGTLIGWDMVPRSELGCDGFFIDEASMVSEEIYKDLKTYQLPLVFIGDHGQLEPIGSDFNLMKNPDYTLEEIHRNAGDIAKFAERLRQGYSAISFPYCEKVQFVKSKRLATETLMDVDQVICAYNKTRVALNKQIREGLNFSGLLNVGERVMCLKNNKNLGLFNGMQGIVKRLYECEHTGRKLMDFEFNDCLYSGIWYCTKQFGQEKPDNSIYMGKEYPNPFDYAYAITCHKAQGDEWGKVLVVEQKCSMWDHTRWAYTAASRAKELVVWAY